MANQVKTLRPDGLHSADGWVAVNASTGAVTTAPADFWTFLQDNNDGTYDESPTGNMRSLALHFANFAVPNRAQIRGITPRVRVGAIRVDDGLAALNVRLATGPVTRLTMHPTIQRIDASTTLRTYITGAVPRNPWGDVWTQLQLDQIQLHLARTFDWDRDRIAVHELYLDVAYNEAPSVVLTGPADEDAVAGGNQVTSTSTPTFTWTYADAEGDPQERVHVGVWPESVYSTWPAGFVPTFHFDPALRTPGAVWYAGPVLTSDLFLRATTPLANGNYEVWMQAADAGSNARYSAAASRRWTQAVPGPPPPTLSLAVSTANARIEATATANSEVGKEPSFLRWEQRDGTGPWSEVRGAGRVAVTPGQTLVAHDREAPPGKARDYRARSGRVVAGEDVVGDASPVLSATQVLDSWWMKVLQDASLDIRVQPFATDNPDLRETSREQAGEYPVIGDYPVTVSAGFADNRFPVNLLFRSRTTLDAFTRNRALWRTVLIQSPRRQWYGRIMPELQTGTRLGNVWVVEAEFSERRRPR